MAKNHKGKSGNKVLKGKIKDLKKLKSQNFKIEFWTIKCLIEIIDTNLKYWIKVIK